MTWYEVMFLDYTQPDVPTITIAIFTSIVDAARYVEGHNNENSLVIKPKTTSQLLNTISYNEMYAE